MANDAAWGQPGEGPVRDLSSYAFSPLRHGEVSLYRGSGNGLPPLLLITAEKASLGCLNRLQHEYKLAADLDAAWAVQPIELSRHRNRAALVLEDPGGTLLDRLLGQPLGTTAFLRIAISLAWALREAHAHGLIHKDLKPANILVDVASSRVWLTGFGIAARVPRERPNPEPPEQIAGTLAYMAPEQTGRMNRSVDSRSDLYSLGVTFYEMLTGTLPFTAADPMEWVHCHIARQPVPPDARTVGTPTALSLITMKLLAKTAEERYQTAAGLEADLRRCLAEWERDGRIEPFPLGTRDVSDRLLIPERLYGRESELETLLACFDRVVAHGTPELVLVTGFSGIGKSSLVHELHKVLVHPRGLYASGKFDQQKRDIPYATLSQAFRSLVQSLLTQSERELARWRDSLSDALGSNGQLIVNLIPELELIIGKPPSVPELPPQDAKSRFQMVFRRFLGVFARKEHPLALFLDDLQWLDSGTLDLLEHLITHPEVRHLLLVAAYRDNEVGPSHRLMRTLDAIRETGARVHEIVLAPLGFTDIGRFIADALHCEAAHARTLAELVEEKTGGNPFFAIQFLIEMAEDGLLAFDPDAAAWTWDIARIGATNYTDNVVDLMVRRLKRLPLGAQDALTHLACLGSVVEVDMLSIVYPQTVETMHTTLEEAVSASLIVSQGNNYKFLHDRIQQAAYSQLPEQHRAAVHLGIGRKLLTNMTGEAFTEQLFEVAGQFNRGAEAIVDRDEKAQVAAINLRAARKAKASAAYASALEYFAAGMALLDEQDGRRRHDLKFGLLLGSAECELLCGSLQKVVQQIAELLQCAASDAEVADAACLKINLHVLMGEHPQAVYSALASLRLLGIDLPEHPTLEQVSAEYETVWQTLSGRAIEALIDLPLMTDPKVMAAMQVLSALTGPATFTDYQLSCLLACRMVRISMQHGMSGAAAHAYAYLGSVLGPDFHRYREGHRLARLACDLVEKHGFISYDTKVSHAVGLAAFWTEPITSVIDLRRATTRTATERGDLTFACYGMHQSITYLLTRNDPLDAVWRESEMALAFSRTAKFRDVVDLILSQQRFIASMQGRDAIPTTFSDERFDEAALEARPTAAHTTTVICLHWIRKLKARYLFGDFIEARASANKAKALLRNSSVQLQLLDYFYYTALAVAALYEEGSADEQSAWHEILRAHQEQLREWADTYPPTFSDKHALTSAELARIEGRDADAMRLYDHAIQSARENGFVQNEGVAHEVAARFYAARGAQTVARAKLRDARQCYLRWGGLGKVRQLERLHPWLADTSSPSELKATIDTPVEQLDVRTVVKASQAVSSEIELGKLIATLMRIALEHAGAQRALLILFKGEEPRIAAEARTSGDNFEVTLRNEAVTPSELIESILHTAMRTRESAIVDDASVQIPFSTDPYVRLEHARSVLCLPLVKQAKLVGALYLENNLTPRVFTPARSAVLMLVASQAAISLENAFLFTDLQQENSDRRRAEEALRRSEAYLAEAQALSHTGTFSWTPATGKIYWSSESYRIHGIDRTTSPDMPLIIRQTHPEDRESFERVLDDARRQRKDFNLEYRLLMPDESVKHLQVVARALVDESGQPEFVGAVMDITQRKRVEEAQRMQERERETMQRQLQQAAKMEAIGRLAGGIAHDFNNILGAILGYGELVQDNLAKGNALRRYIDQVMLAGARGKGLVDRILAFSRGGVNEHLPLRVRSILEETLELLAPSLPPDVRLERRLGEAETTVLGDATQLHQVVMNLCTNAVQAMGSAGVLTVAIERTVLGEPRLLSHGTLGAGSYIRLAVGDTGGGIPPAVLEHMFEPFFTTKRVGEGTGLGLALVHGIVADFGGAIDVTTQVGAGTTFTTWLPALEEVHTLAAEPAGEPPRGRGETVMIVDDEPALVALAQETLTELGYGAVAFDSGVLALQAFLAQPERFDLVLTDEMMPELTGTELAREINQLRPEIPIVIMSGYSDMPLRERAQSAGVVSVLGKPLVRRNIAEAIARALRARQTISPFPQSSSFGPATEYSAHRDEQS
jgi:PAS domain S-box-containing protein